MGTCYNVLVEVKWGACWVAEAYFDLGKTYELARCFPHQRWPRDDDHGFRQYNVGKVARAFYEHEFADTGLAWGTLAEVEALYGEEMKKSGARDFPACRAIFAAARVFREAGAEVRLLLWSD
jgi:hypothetical protein